MPRLARHSLWLLLVVHVGGMTHEELSAENVQLRSQLKSCAIPGTLADKSIDLGAEGKNIAASKATSKGAWTQYNSKNCYKEPGAVSLSGSLGQKSVDACKKLCMDKSGCDCIQMWKGKCHLRKQCVIDKCADGGSNGQAYINHKLADMANSWDDYEVISDQWKGQTRSCSFIPKIRLKCNGPAQLFWSRTVSRWENSLKVPFNRNPLANLDKKIGIKFSPTQKAGYHYDPQMKRWIKSSPFKTIQECKTWNTNRIAKFGKCGKYGGCDGCAWWSRKVGGYGCPKDMNKYDAPCDAFFSKASHYMYQEEGTVTKTMRYEDHKSADGHKRSFIALTVKGETVEGAKCEMETRVRLGTCKRPDCCCKFGLVRYELQNEDKTGTDACHTWFVSAVTGVGNFFSVWRLDSVVKITETCGKKVKSCFKSGQ